MAFFPTKYVWKSATRRLYTLGHSPVSYTSSTETQSSVIVARWSPRSSVFAAVLDAGRRGGATVVCDVPRQLTPVCAQALEVADLVIVMTSCDVRAIAATAALSGVLRTVNQNVGLVVRGPSPGGLRSSEAAQATELPLLAAMRPEPGLDQHLESGGWRMRRRSPLSRAAQTVLATLHPREVAV